jgi:hypothetical protein
MMGEAKKRRDLLGKATVALTRKLMDEGNLIEAGFAIFAASVIPKDAPQVQRDEMLLAFMAGAQHVFASIVTALDPGDDATDADLRRMDLLHQELERWAVRLKDRAMPAQGSA